MRRPAVGLPTIFSLAGEALPTGRTIDGRDLSPYLTQTGSNHGFSASISNPLLFNVEQDPHERFDLSGANPSVVNQMKTLRTNFLNAVSSEGTFW